MKVQCKRQGHSFKGSRNTAWGPSPARTSLPLGALLGPSPASLMSMLPSSNRFSVLRSRWTMLWLWQYSTADRICQNFLRASLSLRCPVEVK